MKRGRTQYSCPEPYCSFVAEDRGKFVQHMLHHSASPEMILLEKQVAALVCVNRDIVDRVSAALKRDLPIALPTMESIEDPNFGKNGKSPTKEIRVSEMLDRFLPTQNFQLVASAAWMPGNDDGGGGRPVKTFKEAASVQTVFERRIATILSDLRGESRMNALRDTKRELEDFQCLLGEFHAVVKITPARACEIIQAPADILVRLKAAQKEATRLQNLLDERKLSLRVVRGDKSLILDLPVGQSTSFSISDDISNRSVVLLGSRTVKKFAVRITGAHKGTALVGFTPTQDLPIDHHGIISRLISTDVYYDRLAVYYRPESIVFDYGEIARISVEHNKDTRRGVIKFNKLKEDAPDSFRTQSTKSYDSCITKACYPVVYLDNVVIKDGADHITVELIPSLCED